MTSCHLHRTRLELVSAGARLGQAGLILPGEGNLSVLVDAPGRSIVMTPRGVDKARLDAASLVAVTWPEGDHGRWRRLELPERASTEARMHLAVYEERPGTRAVVHAHPPRVLALAGRGLLPDVALLDEGVELLGGVGWVPALTPGSLRLAQEVATALLDVPACVLERHGAVTVGDSLEEALRRMLLLERLAGLTLEGV